MKVVQERRLRKLQREGLVSDARLFRSAFAAVLTLFRAAGFDAR
jgi:hypothetical protein